MSATRTVLATCTSVALSLAFASVSFAQGIKPGAPLPPKKPKPTPTATVASDRATVTLPASGTSLVGPDGDAARRWITPTLRARLDPIPGNKILYDKNILTQITVINPDTQKSTRVRTFCYSENGQVVGNSEDKTVGKLTATIFGVPADHAWCRIDSTLPVVAYASIRHYTRLPVESFFVENIRFFKATP